MPPAIIGGAIAGVGAIGSAVIGSKASSKASKAAAASADAASQVQRETYAQNKELLSPYVNAGLPATQAINALLGLPAAQAQAAPAAQPAAYGSTSLPTGGAGFRGLIDKVQQQNQPATAAPTAFSPSITQPTAEQAFDNYRNSTGYQFRLGEGMNALNSGYAGAGSIKSGAAMKASQEYGQGIASQEFGNYLNALGNQQALGMGAASATAGVGQNYANTMGNIAIGKGENQANAALANAQLMGSTVNSLATIGAGMAGYGKR